MAESGKEVRAAGGLLWEKVAGELLVLAVHRAHYDDWSFPKGKRDADETDLECAVREVLEETGFHVVVGEPLPDVEYTDHKGRPKSVAYWAMTRLDQAEVFAVNEEVDEIRWVDFDTARELLTYDLDRHLLNELLLQMSIDG